MKRALLRLALVCVAAAIAATAHAGTILVSAAASLTDALTQIGRAYSASHPGQTVRFNFAASGSLQRQIEQGAPVDLFISAGPLEMDELQKEGRIVPSTRAILVRNRLVLIAPSGSSLRSWDDLKSARVRRVAMSNPDSVPSGRYALETLQRRGLWPIVHPKAVYGENVRQTLAYVAQRDVDAGIVFATDAAIDRARVRIVAYATAGEDLKPIVYPMAEVAGGPDPAGARAFEAFLESPPAQRILAQYGFEPATPAVHRSREAHTGRSRSRRSG